MISRISSGGWRIMDIVKLHHALNVIIGESMKRDIPQILNAE